MKMIIFIVFDSRRLDWSVWAAVNSTQIQSCWCWSFSLCQPPLGPSQCKIHCGQGGCSSSPWLSLNILTSVSPPRPVGTHPNKLYLCEVVLSNDAGSPEETAFVLMYSLSYLWDQSNVKLVLFMLP